VKKPLLCKIGIHRKKEQIDKNRSLFLGGSKCSLCDKVLREPFMWPEPPPRPKTEAEAEPYMERVDHNRLFVLVSDLITAGFRGSAQSVVDERILKYQKEMD